MIARAACKQYNIYVAPGKGGHLTVRLGAQIKSLPMHGSGKEIGKGLPAIAIL